MIKRFILLFALFPTLSFAAGDYDGIWETDNNILYSIHQNGDVMVFTELRMDSSEFSVLVGVSRENLATLLLFNGPPRASIRLDITFTSASSLSINMIECTGPFGFPCSSTPLPAFFGTAQRIF